MKAILTFLFSILAVAGLRAANPAFQDFYATNGIVVRTNSNKVSIDGMAGQPRAIWTNNNGIVHLTTNVTKMGFDDTTTFIVNENRIMGIGQNVITNYTAGVVDVTAVGWQALKNLSTGIRVAAVGDDALGVNTSGRQNTAMGSQALFSNTTGEDQTAVGFQALSSVTVSNRNTGFGSQALAAATGEENVGVGYRAGLLSETGIANTLLGTRADVKIGESSSNVVVGASSQANQQTVSVGHRILLGSSSGRLTLVGAATGAGNQDNSAAFGYGATVTANNQQVFGVGITEYVFSDGAVKIQGTTVLMATNTAMFNFITTNLSSGQTYTNFSQRGHVVATVALTNVVAADVSAMSLIVDQDADGTWDTTNGPARINGVALSAGSEQLFGLLQPGARFAFTNQSAGASPSATIVPGTCQWSRW